MPSLPHLVFGQLTLEHDDNMIPTYNFCLTITQTDTLKCQCCLVTDML